MIEGTTRQAARPPRRDLAVALSVSMAALGVASCYGPPEDRALRDLEVGKATSDALSVEVQDGLGVVRSMSDERLAIWANAPRLDVDVTVDEPLADLELELSNVLASAVLTTPGEVRVTSESAPGPTRRSYVLDVPAGTSRLTIAAPGSDAPAAFQFALLSDIQRAIDTVGDVYTKINEQPDVEFVLSAGDLTSSGTPAQMRRFERELEALSVPYFATLGNHELGTSPPVFHDYFGRGSAHFRHRGVAFTLVDSAGATLEPTVYGWLDGWMAESVDVTHVVAMHVPPIEPIGVRNGSFASRNEAAKLLGRLARGGVDLTLYGHLHTYFEFENAGMEAHVSGGGGAIPERFDGIGRHFVVIEVDPDLGVLDRHVVRVD